MFNYVYSKPNQAYLMVSSDNIIHMWPTEAEFSDFLSELSIAGITSVINGSWNKIYFGAVPYLSAMETLENINDNYGYDSAKNIVLYFLSNATSYRGEIARLVKTELKNRCNMDGKRIVTV